MTTADEEIQFVDLAAQRRRIGSSLDEAIAGVLDHCRFVMGPEVALLENQLTRYTGSPHAVSCGSGTDALLLALLALGIGPGDSVLVPSFTFAATAGAVSLLGASPVFVDVLESTFNLDPDDLDRTAAWAKRAGLSCRAVVPVDLFGQPADYDAIGEVAARHELTVIGDAAQSMGGLWSGKTVGTLATLTATSFFPAKPLGCYGDGGAVFTADADLAARLRSIRVHGQGADKYDNVRVGMNGRLDTIQAAVLLEKLRVFDEELAARRRIAARYDRALRAIVGCPEVDKRAESAWAQYTLRVSDRDRVAKELATRGVPTAIYYPLPLHLQPAFAGQPRSPGGLANSVRLAAEVVSLPAHPYLRANQQDQVIDAVIEAVRS